jgi:hypothetical protein
MYKSKTWLSILQTTNPEVELPDCFLCFEFEMVLTMLPRLALNSWAQAILLPHLPK